MESQRDDAYRRNYQAFELNPGEVVGQSWFASQGMLVVTTQRLLYEPMRTPKALIEPVASLFGQAAVGKLITTAIDISGGLREPWSEPLSEIASVDPVGDAGLRITLTSGETREIELSGSLWSTRFSSANTAARAEAVGVIRATAAGSIPSGPSIADPTPLQHFFVAVWKVMGIPHSGDVGTLQLDANGVFDGRFVLFGALPDGTQFAGVWWLTDPFGILVLQGRVIEPRADVVFPLQLPIAIQQLSQTGFVGESAENEGVPVIFSRI